MKRALAIAAWQTAARWYLPGAPHVDEACVRLSAQDPDAAAWALGLHAA